ncbi:transport sec9 [Hyphodiscus hymeniophilus]|uniref:Protein transport protein SEC9 n=1 Tax=Hyphodiscus hymeniophilus TaxID=353542 RepID=A0A9P6VM09_9HELO|nr:transport sec9 [Hyphodiscus hymeniophilus]
MKKFGFGKKGDDRDEDSARSALFSRSKKSSPAPVASNPYAQPPQAADPYAQDTNKYANMGPVGPSGPSPYQAARQNLGHPGGSPAGGLPSGPGQNRGPSGGPPGGSSAPAYGRAPASNGSGYGAEKYGSGGGYGANRYDGPPADTGSKYGPGGYGGMGRRNSNDTTTTEDNRDALFGGAKDRFAQKASLPPSNGRPGGGYAADSGTSGDSNEYGAYGEERQLTAEEEEEEDVAATKQQIRFMKQEDVSSTRNALRIAQQAEETGRATLARLGAQGERIHNTEKNLDLAANHNRVAEEKAKELKTLNKSMFAVHVSNPFTSAQRKAARDQEIIDKHQSEREQRDATRKAAFGSQQRMERAFKDVQPGDPGYRAPQTKASLAERSKFQFEADSEDDEMENEIDSNMDALGHAAGRLHALAQATGREVDDQNIHIDRIIQKSDRVDDQIAMNRARLDRIR